jgi:hypothetical protein
MDLFSFLIHAHALGDLIQSHVFKYHLYANDSQIYIFFSEYPFLNSGFHYLQFTSFIYLGA